MEIVWSFLTDTLNKIPATIRLRTSAVLSWECKLIMMEYIHCNWNLVNRLYFFPRVINRRCAAGPAISLWGGILVGRKSFPTSSMFKDGWAECASQAKWRQINVTCFYCSYLSCLSIVCEQIACTNWTTTASCLESTLKVMDVHSKLAQPGWMHRKFKMVEMRITSLTRQMLKGFDLIKSWLNVD